MAKPQSKTESDEPDKDSSFEMATQQTAKNPKVAGRGNKKKDKKKRASAQAIQAKFPRHTVEKVLRIPLAILEQNAGKDCTDREAAKFVSVGFNGPFRVEISSAIKYGFLDRPAAGRIRVTDLARKILRPQEPNDKIEGFRKAVLNAPDISDVYNHYRGEHLPDRQFFENALVDKFKIPKEKLSEFIEVFTSALQAANLVEFKNDKSHVLDVSKDASTTNESDTTRIKKLSRDVKIEITDTCFVMMPFAAPLGQYYASIYEPAIKKAGLRPVRADAEIFGTGKIIDQVWAGIKGAKVLVAELTKRNPNVFYELGLAHALQKPVVLVSSNEEDVPFDLKHIRVIYYDQTDPFWGSKLLEKVAENVLSAIRNPEEALFARAVESV